MHFILKKDLSSYKNLNAHMQVAVIKSHRDVSMITETYNAINTNKTISQLNPTIKKGRSAA